MPSALGQVQVAGHRGHQRGVLEDLHTLLHTCHAHRPKKSLNPFRLDEEYFESPFLSATGLQPSSPPTASNSTSLAWLPTSWKSKTVRLFRSPCTKITWLEARQFRQPGLLRQLPKALRHERTQQRPSLYGTQGRARCGELRNSQSTDSISKTWCWKGNV